MANADTPFGLRPIGNLYGAPYTGGLIQVAFAAAEETDTFVGDLVKLEGASDSEGRPTVNRGVDEDTAFFAVITAFEPDRTNLELKYRKADTARVAYAVPVTAGQLFLIQADEDIEDEDIGATADILDSGTGDTTTGLSAMELQAATVGSGLNLQIMSLYRSEDNAFGTNAKVVVRVNENAISGVGTGT